jgi:putative endopeptidase
MGLVSAVLRTLAVLAVAALAVNGVRAADLAPGIPTSNIDPTCKPCEDFYQFAVGGFLKEHPRPPEFPRWGAFSILAEQNRDVLHEILERAATNTLAPPGSNEQKIGAYYRSCMDEAGIERAGLGPLQPQLDAIAKIASINDLVRVSGELQRIGVVTAWQLDSGPDAKDSSRTIAELGPGRLGLPDRDSYLTSDARSETLRAQYEAYAAKLLVLAGTDGAGAPSAAHDVLAFETRLARVRPSRVDMRDPQRTYHLQSLADVSRLAPVVDWSRYAAAAGAPAFTQLNDAVPDYVHALDEIVTSTPLATWKAYLTFRLLDTYAPALPRRFAAASFAFRSGNLLGVTSELPRWRRCVAAVDGALGEALGAVYVVQAFPPSAKTQALALVNNLQSVLHEDIEQLDWMGPATRSAALAKLEAYGKKIGYPDRFRSYAALDVAGVPYAANVLAARRFASDYELMQIGRPTDRFRWGMSPPTVNAYYSPGRNEIVFPAGILQPPFFSAQTDDAVNYGAIGAIIGHEMTHGFDNLGRQFDAQGNLHDWWTSADADRFTARAQCIVDEFSAFEVVPGVHENGQLVQGEAIADLGGLTIAYRAFQRTAQYRARRSIDGYTPEQRFFLAYAQAFAASRTDAYARILALSDPHPDDRLRVIGALANFAPFREAFHCVAGDPMVRATSCKIW